MLKFVNTILVQLGFYSCHSVLRMLVTHLFYKIKNGLESECVPIILVKYAAAFSTKSKCPFQ